MTEIFKEINHIADLVCEWVLLKKMTIIKRIIAIHLKLWLFRRVQRIYTWLGNLVSLKGAPQATFSFSLNKKAHYCTFLEVQAQAWINQNSIYNNPNIDHEKEVCVVLLRKRAMILWVLKNPVCVQRLRFDGGWKRLYKVIDRLHSNFDSSCGHWMLNLKNFLKLLQL